ncbi:MAG TPA: phage portal protein [Solirubrobacteraceae bacterium]
MQLRAQREFGLAMYAWYEGTQDPPDQPIDPSYGYSGAFLRLRQMARGAWARLVVDTIAERLAVTGIRTTVGEDADKAAWALLQANRIDSDQADVHREAFITGVSYVSIAGSGEDVRLTPETALEVTHEHAPGDRRSVAAALKVYELSTRQWVAELYTPEAVAVWVAEYRSGDRDPFGAGARPPWSDDPVVSPNPLGAVPFVPFENRPTAATPGESELRELIPIMQRIQELELAKLVAAHTAVFRQKWATGLRVPRDPETGQPVEPFKQSVSRLWVNEAPDGKFGSFEATEIAQYLRAIDAEIAELAAISRVPSYYLVQTELANPPSAESLLAAESGLVAKCIDRQGSFGESWEQVVRIGASAAGASELAQDVGLETVWRVPERRNPAAVADAATKLQAVGIPQAEVWAFLGYSPQAIERMQVEAAAEALIAPEPPPSTPQAAA